MRLTSLRDRSRMSRLTYDRHRGETAKHAKHANSMERESSCHERARRTQPGKAGMPIADCDTVASLLSCICEEEAGCCAFQSQNQLGRLADEVIYQNDLAGRLQTSGLGLVRREVPVTSAPGFAPTQPAQDSAMDQPGLPPGAVCHARPADGGERRATGSEGAERWGAER
jgi:hypothetical protein